MNITLRNLEAKRLDFSRNNGDAEVNERVIPRYKDDRGSLIVLEQGEYALPFIPIRSFLMYDVPISSVRAKHAVDCWLFLFAVLGEFQIKNKVLNQENIWKLRSNQRGVVVPPYNYLELSHFSAPVIVCALASKQFKDTNYFSLVED